ncbi:DNA-directed RNA polymerase subunit alpha [Pseudoroseomonas deserti]|uniref:DNA-directed RNA polymerase subunit alpha n=1 Tax=Teichococcus deserti TaxID=1817963 RepID=A0A1V2H6R2_9PROT|nr:ABC transporter permease [Pseudoroseomonas deserti]ONG58098.1 DNA-directed RNA polymerase subunit alpha [Pseudoroseomonas deserti]
MSGEALSDVPPPRRRRRWPLLGLLGGAIVVFWLAMAFLGGLVAPHDAGRIVDMDVFTPMTAAFPLGTDYLGRDMLSRILHGTRYTVGVALAATLLASGSGLVLGMAAATRGGWTDLVLSRCLDTLSAMPSKMFALVVVAAFGSSVPVLVLAAGIIYTPGAYRIARSLAVGIAAMDYVRVARARGEGTAYILREEILPNMTGPVLADFGLRFVFIVLLLSGLSFLGLGVQPPNADWGSLVRENIGGLAEGAPAVLMPALAIASLTIGVNLLIDNLGGFRRRGGEGA